MVNILTIPKKLAQKGELIIIPRAEYDEITGLKKRLLREEKDTDETIHVFEKEYQNKKLKKASTFSEILGTARKSK